MFEILGGTLKRFLNWLRVFVVYKCEHESDVVSTWAKLDGFTYKQCPFVCKSTVKEFVVVYM